MGFRGKRNNSERFIKCLYLYFLYLDCSKKIKMDAELKKSILKTGTTTLGIVCKDGIVIAADRRVSFGTSDNQGVAYIAGKHPKIFEVFPNVLVTTAGQASDTRKVIKIVRAELKLKELRSRSKPKIKQIANLFSSMLYQNIRQPSMIPSIAHFLLSGYDEDGFYLYDVMPDGFLEKIEDYAASGSGMVQVNPILDSDYHKNISIEEGIKLAKKCIKASMGRDPGTGEGIDIYVVKKGEVEPVLTQKTVLEFK